MASEQRNNQDNHTNHPSHTTDQGDQQRKIWLVPTPIGNLGDITLRALEVLQTADAIACEDTRRTGLLLKHLQKYLQEHGQIQKPLVRLDAHTMYRAEDILQKYPRLAYVSDAGTPGISDPGAELVSLAIREGIDVEVLTGATAFVPALVLSGLPCARFCFEGFLPRKGRERKERLNALAQRAETSVLYESPHRLYKTLAELSDMCGPDRQASVTRELSKRFEETRRGPLSELTEHFAQTTKGEICIVIAGQGTTRATRTGQDETDAQTGSHLEELQTLARTWQAEGHTTREIRAKLMQQGLSKNAAYALVLQLKPHQS